MSQRALFPRDALPRALRADFDAFWNAYPRRNPNPRANAEVAFLRAVKHGATPEDLVRAADAYAAECRQRGIGSEFIVHASTFLRQQRFLDYLRSPVAEAPERKQSAIDHPLWPHMRDAMTAADFRRWIEPLIVVRHIEGEAALLQAPTPFHRDWVGKQFRPALRQALGIKVLDIEIAKEIQP